jgi:hypothetical protein
MKSFPGQKWYPIIWATVTDAWLYQLAEAEGLTPQTRLNDEGYTVFVRATRVAA